MVENLLKDIPLFVAVARHKSFTAAADELDMPISTMSRRIKRMEKKIGVPLLVRNSRHVELTASGGKFYERAVYIVAEAENAVEQVAKDAGAPSGWVRVALSSDIFHGYLRGAMGPFAERYPDIRLNFQFVTRHVDILSEPYDLELRVGPLADSSLRVRRLRSIPSGLYASGLLLERYPPPEKPEDIALMPYIGYNFGSGTIIIRKGSIETRLALNPVHTVGSPSLALDFAIAGMGIAALPTPMADFVADRADLVRLFPEWTTPPADVSVIMPNVELPRRVRVFVDYLADYFKTLSAASLGPHPGNPATIPGKKQKARKG